MDMLTGQLLIASPKLPDPVFARTVVLLVQHDSNGAFGIVLNRPSDLTVGQLWARLHDDPCESTSLVSIGGPVDGPVMVLHTDPSHSEAEVASGIHIASDRANVRHIIQNAVEPFRVFTGYAGWGGGQLETELNLGGWLTIEADPAIVFTTETTDVWQKAVHVAGRGFLSDTLGIHEFPEDLGLN